MKPTVILITGYARSGKDTFSDALERNCIKAVAKGIAVTGRTAFGDTLKDAANGFLDELGLHDHAYRRVATEQGVAYEGPFFHDEEFKKRWRSVLVELGTMARAIDRDVFVRKTATDVFEALTDPAFDNLANLEIVTDCRYLNELMYFKDRMGKSIRVITVRVHTADVDPANEEEAMSIAEIQREVCFDAEFYWRLGDLEQIDRSARHLLEGIGFPLNG